MKRTYATEQNFEKDRRALAQDGWTVKSVSHHKDSYSPSKGCCLFIIFAPLALFARGKSKIIVMYEKE